MPVPLPMRLGPDTIRKFERAAEGRIDEAIVLRDAGKHLAALYLVGYSVEMALGGAYFRLLRYGPTDPITRQERQRVVAFGRLHHLMRPEPHDIPGWARLLVHYRDSLGPTYPTTAFAILVVNKAEEVYNYWRPEMRYRNTEVTSREVNAALAVAQWFQRQYRIL